MTIGFLNQNYLLGICLIKINIYLGLNGSAFSCVEWPVLGCISTEGPVFMGRSTTEYSVNRNCFLHLSLLLSAPEFSSWLMFLSSSFPVLGLSSSSGVTWDPAMNGMIQRTPWSKACISPPSCSEKPMPYSSMNWVHLAVPFRMLCRNRVVSWGGFYLPTPTVTPFSIWMRPSSSGNLGIVYQPSHLLLWTDSQPPRERSLQRADAHGCYTCVFWKVHILPTLTGTWVCSQPECGTVWRANWQLRNPRTLSITPSAVEHCSPNPRSSSQLISTILTQMF